MPSTSLAPEATERTSGTAARLAVAWQHPVSRRIEPVGLLSCIDGGFCFNYLARALDVPGFQPFLGFPDLTRTYTSARLFPLFAQRVMRRTRPDYARHLSALGLDDRADQWDVLARSQGQRQGDGVRLFAEPLVTEAGQTYATFFVSGIRHRVLAESQVEEALSRLDVGDELRLLPQPTNEVDSNALLVAEHNDVALGWVPSVLLPYVTTVRIEREPVVTVRAAHGADVVPAYRLLVTVRGHVPADYRPFDGPAWTLAADAPPTLIG